MRKTETERYAALRAIARRRGQRGYFTTRQAIECDFTPRDLRRLVERNVITREARAVYRFTVSSLPTWKDLLAAELLATGGTACALTSAALYNAADPPPRPRVLVPRGSRNAVPGRHTTRELLDEECTTIDGLRTLGPIRMVLDSVHRLPRHKARALVESVIVRNLVDPDALRKRAVELANPKRPGCKIAIEILDDLHPELARSRNEWEALVVRRAKELGLPEPSLEFEIVLEGRRYILDAAWPDSLVALEFDGRDPHMRKTVHDRDSARHNDLADAGWRRFSITAGALQRGDDRAFRQVARALSKRPAA